MTYCMIEFCDFFGWVYLGPIYRFAMDLIHKITLTNKQL